jgi:predicted nucleic acid-binding protein
MTKYVIGPDVALRLAQREASLPSQHRLLAPTLLRSQVLAQLFAGVRRGELDRRTAERRLDYLRGLPLRLLGDRVLQRAAWKIAEQLGWADTFVAEYVALTQLQGDALVCMDRELSRALSGIVVVASLDDLVGRPAAHA